MSLAEQETDKSTAELREGDREHDEAQADAAPDDIAFEVPEEPEAEEGELSASEARGHDATRVKSWASTAFNDSYVRIENLIVGSTDRVAVPLADVTRAAEIAATHHAKPEHFDALVAALAKPETILLVGSSCGKRTSAYVALNATGHSPIIQLSSEVPPRSLVDAIEKIRKRSRKAGIIVEAVDRQTLARLTGFEMLRLKESLTDGARVIITTTPSQGAPVRIGGVCIVHCEPPRPGQVLEHTPGSPDAKDRARAALALLSNRKMTPADVVELLDLAMKSDRSPEQLAQVFDGRFTSTVLAEWLGAERSAKQLAYLTAGTVLEGAPSVDVDLESEALADQFSAGLEPPSEGVKTFSLTDRGWPEGVLEVAVTSRGTHFGRHELEVVQVVPPHSRERIIEYLWRQLGTDFRQPFTVWLRGLAASRDSLIRLGAAASAGVLFTVDPVLAERELLRPWALEQTFSRRLCAAVALGAPVTIGADPSGARALARAWSTSSDLRLRHVAVLAYGGPLGAWDQASAAPMHLWRIASESPTLSRVADVSLASLMTAGENAGLARASVLSLLTAEARSARVPARVYALLPLIFRHLTARGRLASQSLNALVNQSSERRTFESLGDLFALTLLASSGYESALRAVTTLLHAVGDARVEQATALAVLGVVKASAQDPETAQAIDARLRRALSTGARDSADVADVAHAVLETLFPAS
jgi:hypothetical protein